MVSSPGPPPDYTRTSSPAPSEEEDSGTQLLISPRPEVIDFQNGYLGADGERAAIEGEVQIKAVDPSQWRKAIICLRAIEQAPNTSVELYSSEIILYDVDAAPSSSVSSSVLPSSIPFAIPLMVDTPQTVRTPFSALVHTLTATLIPVDSKSSPLIESIEVFPRRYTSHTFTIPISPETFTITEPSEVKIEVPRTTFKVGEVVPAYVTIPPPPRDLIVNTGLQLRNVRVELIRAIAVKTEEGATSEASKSKKALLSGDAVDEGDSAMTYKSVVSRSGASCRFHTSKPIRLRLLLHPPDPSSPQMLPAIPSSSTSHTPQSNSSAASITQTTILHTVSFHLSVNVAFLAPTHTETIRLPITILPPSAPLPEVEPGLDAEYRKKHDRPPMETVRRSDTEILPDAAEAGPSGVAPPPFSEQDEPPPFTPLSGPSVVRLPTFTESTTDDIVVPHSPDGIALPHAASSIPGEGILFGFPASAHFDGHADQPGPRGNSLPPPPPTIHEALQDPDVSTLAPLRTVLEPLSSGEHGLPPPPPAMDDPSDPPPSIHSEFRTRRGDDMGPPPDIDSAFHTHGQLLPPPGLESTSPALTDDLYAMPPPEGASGYHHAPPPPPHESYAALPPSTTDSFAPPPTHQFGRPPSTDEHTATSEVAPVHAGGHAPPPYRVPEDGENGHVARPPPYAG